MVEKEVQTQLLEMNSRCLLESAEFLFKAGLIVHDTFLHQEESIRMRRARNLFYMKEYYQASYILLCSKNKDSYEYCTCCIKEAIFVRNYAMYIHSTIKQEPEKLLIVDQQEISDKEIEKSVRSSLRLGGKQSTFFDSPVFNDSYIVFHFVLSKLAYFSENTKCKILLYLVKKLPFLWNTYKMLADECTFSNMHTIISYIDNQQMKDLFMLYLGAKKCILHKKIRNLAEKKQKSISECSEYVQSMVATILGHLKQYKAAHEIFKALLEHSATRDNLDQLANILYSLKDVNKLSSLLLTMYDRYFGLPIYHYVAGNLLSLRSNSIGSIEQFQKILSDSHPGELDIAYLFMAHEYLILKDTSSAIKACNLAIKKNYNDHRVWSNMAQIYFEIDMFDYALHFYRKCAELSPEDSGVYEELGKCFEKLEKEQEAIRCYKKGVTLGNMKCYSLLGDLYLKEKNTTQYKIYYTKYLNSCLFSDSKIAEHENINLEVAERIIASLEGIADPESILRWRQQCNLSLHGKAR